MIKLLKSGNWALGGTQIVEMTEGAETSFGPASDFELVKSGWAEWIKVELPAEEPNDELVAEAEAEAEADTSAIADVAAEVVAEEPARKPKAK